MKRTIIILLLVTGLSVQVHAQLGLGTLLNQTVGRIIRAIDLGVQRAQNKTLFLQNAQKAIENQLHQLQLSAIAGVSEQQKSLFSGYYQELLTVKSVISDYEQVKSILVRQKQLVGLYQTSWSLTRRDGHFNSAELQQISAVYAGILRESAANLDQLAKVINSLQTQMTDGQRLEMIDRISRQIYDNYHDLKKFTNENILLSLQRSKDQQDVQTIKNLYGIH